MLPHHKYTSNYPHSVWLYKHDIAACMSQTLATSNIIFTCHFNICARENMSTKLYIYVIYLTNIYGRCICIYVSHINSLASTMWPGTLYTYNNANTNTAITPNSWLPGLCWTIGQISQEGSKWACKLIVEDLGDMHKLHYTFNGLQYFDTLSIDLKSSVYIC